MADVNSGAWTYFFESGALGRLRRWWYGTDVLIHRQHFFGTDDFLFKITLVGAPKAGKSSLLRAMAGEACSTDAVYVATAGVDFRVRHGVAAGGGGGKTARVQIWDTSGDAKFEPVVCSYLRGHAAVLLCFDLTSAESFEAIRAHWVGVVDRHSSGDCTRLLVGTKSDLWTPGEARSDETRAATSQLGTHPEPEPEPEPEVVAPPWLDGGHGPLVDRARAFARSSGLRFVCLTSTKPQDVQEELQRLVGDLAAPFNNEAV